MICESQTKARKFTLYQPIILYRKLIAQQIFNGYQMLPDNSVLIIDRNGTIADIVEKADAGEGIEYFNGILSPGFINCHCHLELSHMKGLIPKHTGLIDFVMNIVTGRIASNESILHAIENAESEMMKNGIVAVGDICNTPFTINQKLKKNLHYQNFIEVSGFPEEVAESRFQKILDIYNEFKVKFPHTSIVPHAPYSVSNNLLEKIVAFPGNEIITMHNQETAAENEFFENKQGDFLKLYEQLNITTSSFQSKGKSSLQHTLPYFKINKPLILVHNVFTKESDISYAQTIFSNENAPLYFCLCPNANLYISNLLPDVEMLVRNNVNIVLGTDSLASNDQLSILDEMNTLKNNFPSLTMNQLLQWATLNGARALGIDEKYGSFEKGKTPGVVLIGDNSECSPL